MATIDFNDPSSIAKRTKRSRFSVEWPTLLLAAFIYLSWFLITYFWAQLPVLVLFLAGGWLIAWHGSLQHEVLHGHPTRFRQVNDLIGWVPISLWLPYQLYKRAHLKHHHDEWLTDPIEDPESYYLTGSGWQRMGGFGRMITTFNNTLPGRLLIGPLVAIAAFWGSEITLLASGDRRNLRIWLLHLAGVALVLTWVLAICDMPLWLYLTAFGYCGLAFSRLRSFAEHHYADSKEERTAIVENSQAFGLLFLYNNLHIVHHSLPQLPWYLIPGLYRAKRDAFITLNGGLVYNGYLDVARRYFFHTHHQPVHPQYQASEMAAATEAGSIKADQAITG
jgi:fatty acid desaturase